MRETGGAGGPGGEAAPARASGDGARAGILGVVLAGGLSSRMGREKAFVTLQGRPLIAHVLDRFGPQVGAVVINANGDAGRFAAFGLEVVPDGRPDLAGPLAGIAAGLRAARERGWSLLATCPSDAPFLPGDAVRRLLDGLGDNQAACLSVGDRLEPLFALWRVTALDCVEDALARGRLAVRAAMAEVGHATVPARAGDDLANLNTPEDLAAAATGAGRVRDASSD